jgi:hypothetical protein
MPQPINMPERKGRFKEGPELLNKVETIFDACFSINFTNKQFLLCLNRLQIF